MKRKYKIKLNKKRFKKTLAVLIVLIIVSFLVKPAVKWIVKSDLFDKTEITYTLRNGISLPDVKAGETIVSFFKTYYTALSELETKDLTAYFAMDQSEGYESALINQAALDYLLAYRVAGETDLTFKKCTFGITYKDAETDDNGNLTILLLLDEAIDFTMLEDITSYMCGAEHQFILKKTDDGYKITSHTVEESSYMTIDEAYKYAKEADKIYTNEQIKALIDDKLSKAVSSAQQYLSAYKNAKMDFNTNPLNYSIKKEASHDFDREDAVLYANKWVGQDQVVRNEDQWFVYDSYGGNCCNYVSQCLYAGGIPMDISGSQLWKWYGDTPDNTTSSKGRSRAWTGVGDFYDYCKNNEGFGLAAEVGVNLYSGSAGDAIVMTSGEEWSHVVIITQVIKDQDGKVVDYLINSNTSDRNNYPLSAYGTNRLELIRIIGWND